MYSVHTRSILVITGTNMYQTYFNFPSGSIRLATLTSLRRTLPPDNILSELPVQYMYNVLTEMLLYVQWMYNV
jgi:hypothetical protein